MSWINGPVAGRILEALARYKYLTIGQLVALGAGDEKTVRVRLGELLTAKAISRQEWRLGPGVGRLPNVHWLTVKGARAVAEATGQPAHGMRGRELSAHHAWHRMLTVDALVAADRWADGVGQARPEFSTYMHRPARLALAGKEATPDAVLRGTDTAGNGRVYVLEIYCSHYSEGRSTFATSQLEHYVLAGDVDEFDAALGIPPDGKAARVLVVCDTADLRDRLVRTLPRRDGLPGQESPAWARLHFKAADELADFGRGWWRVDGSHVALPS